MKKGTSFHNHFGLTYANYLVYPRSILEAMPLEWQEEVCKLLDEIPDFSHISCDNYEVKLVIDKKEEWIYDDETDEYIETIITPIYGDDALSNYRYPKYKIVNGVWKQTIF